MAGLVVGIHRLGQAVAFPFIGGWCDRIGYRKPFIAGVVLTSIASALGGLAVGTADLTLYRVLAGVGYGTMNIAAMSAINNMTTSQNRGTAMSVFSAATLAGAAIGPIPGGFIVESMSSQLAGYRWAFYGGGILQMLVGIAAFFVIRDKREPARPTASSAKGMSLFSHAIKNKDVAITSLGVFLFGVSFSAFLYFTVPLMGKDMGLNAERIGWVISGFALGLVVGSLVAGPMSDKVGKRKPFVFFSLLGPGVAILLFRMVGQLPLMVACTFLLGLLTSPSCGIGPTMVTELLPKAPASAMALLRSGEMTGMFVGPMIGGVIISLTNYSTAMLAYAIITMVGSVIFLFTVREPKRASA